MDGILYHISSDGQARPCRAQEGKCPLAAAGAEHGEFSSPDGARVWAELSLQHSHGGSFGNLAIQLAEREAEAEEQRLAEAEAEAGDADQEERALHAAAVAPLLTPEAIHEFSRLGPLKKRKRTKELQAAGVAMGLAPDASLKDIYGAYVRNYDFNFSNVVGRGRVRDSIVAGRLIAQGGVWSYSSHQQTRAAIEKLEERLDAVDPTGKEELNFPSVEPDD